MLHNTQTRHKFPGMSLAQTMNNPIVAHRVEQQTFSGWAGTCYRDLLVATERWQVRLPVAPAPAQTAQTTDAAAVDGVPHLP